MKTVFTIISVFLSTVAIAQTDWWGVQPGVKRYFLNEYFYLRGMRVDSVKTVGSNTVVYPFKSMRGYYLSNQKLQPSGSWLGETITIAPDGTHYFDNYWGDTVIIKSLANLNDSWEMYNDATNRHYTATVTGVNNAPVLGTTDDIKELTITAWNGAGVNSDDPLHNTKIVLSKNHGFIRVPDLFMFPLREPDQSYQRGFDFWLDRDLPAPTVPTASQLFFNLIDFHQPATLEVYDFNVGDVFEYKADGIENVNNSEIEKIILEEIVEKTTSPTAVTYKVARWTHTKNYKNFPPSYSTVPAFVNLNYNKAMLLDTTLMPEEWGQKDIIRYNPADTSFCQVAPSYERLSINIKQDSSITTQDPCGYNFRYKQKAGRTFYHTCWNSAFGGEYLNQLLYTRRNGNSCRDYIALDVEPATIENGISIYPNPASDQIFVNLPTQCTAIIRLHNAVGQQVKQISMTEKSVPIGVAELPEGLYYLSIVQNGKLATEKVLIEH